MTNSDTLRCLTPLAAFYPSGLSKPGLSKLEALFAGSASTLGIGGAFSSAALGDEAFGDEESVLEPTLNLDRFLASVEKRAFQMARIALRDADEALDVVQDAMLQLARNYSARPNAEWKPLFYRILQNRIHDSQRRRMVRNKFFAWLPGKSADSEDDLDPIDNVRDERQGPVDLLMTGQAMDMLEQALRNLPARQQQAFLLRNLEGLDVAETATAMGCSEGSVKTHYSRAVHTLRAHLSDSWGGASS
jgi:RNA polymerase sigma-70 factor, ECF subfamily